METKFCIEEKFCKTHFFGITLRAEAKAAPEV
jgi:hypothetical protein